MLLFHPYVPGIRPADQQACWEALSRLTLGAEDRRVDWPCYGPQGYAEGLALVWQYWGTLVVVEHDIAPDHELLVELGECPEPYCAVDYELAGQGLWSTWADHAPLGLAKLCRRVRYAVEAQPPVPQVPWRDLAGALARRLPPAHVHPGPVEHHHSA